LKHKTVMFYTVDGTENKDEKLFASMR